MKRQHSHLIDSSYDYRALQPFVQDTFKKMEKEEYSRNQSVNFASQQILFRQKEKSESKMNGSLQYSVSHKLSFLLHFYPIITLFYDKYSAIVLNENQTT